MSEEDDQDMMSLEQGLKQMLASVARAEWVVNGRMANTKEGNIWFEDMVKTMEYIKRYGR